MSDTIKTTMKSFAHSTGQSANQKTGAFTGALLGKVAEGLEALEAIGALAMSQGQRFMQLAQTAIKTYAKKLAASHTIPFATSDLEFNSTINLAKAAARTRTPALGLGGSRSSRPVKLAEKHQEKKEE